MKKIVASAAVAGLAASWVAGMAASLAAALAIRKPKATRCGVRAFACLRASTHVRACICTKSAYVRSNMGCD